MTTNNSQCSGTKSTSRYHQQQHHHYPQRQRQKLPHHTHRYRLRHQRARETDKITGSVSDSDCQGPSGSASAPLIVDSDEEEERGLEAEFDDANNPDDADNTPLAFEAWWEKGPERELQQDGKEEWPRIVSEEVDLGGESIYQVKWTNMAHPGKKRITWENASIPPEEKLIWDRARKKELLKKAEESLAVQIPPRMDIFLLDTFFRAEAAEEKAMRPEAENWAINLSRMIEKQSTPGTDVGLLSIDEMDKDNGSEGRVQVGVVKSSSRVSVKPWTDRDWSGSRGKSVKSASPSCSKPTSKPQTVLSPRGKARRGRGWARSSQPSTRGKAKAVPKRKREPSPPIPELTPQKTTKKKLVIDLPILLPFRQDRRRIVLSPSCSKSSFCPETTTDDSMSVDMPSPRRLRIGSSVEFNLKDDSGRYKRAMLGLAWSKIAQAAGAARITFSNEIDEEHIPTLPEEFTYIEAGYICSDNVPDRKDLDSSLFVHCDCWKCTVPSECACQGISELVDEQGNKTIAYSSEGLFILNVTPGMLVIECNKYCPCNIWCPNRVSQRPRGVPIDIFKTRDKGWGARPLIDVKKGTVLGMHAGELMQRREAEELEEIEQDYCFDLDGLETPGHGGGEAGQGMYTVAAWRCGNWTRFINHSSTPNIQVYQVIYDTIPELSMPYHYFTATRDISAREELTVDYNPSKPSNTLPFIRAKPRGRPKRSEGSRTSSVVTSANRAGNAGSANSEIGGGSPNKGKNAASSMRMRELGLSYLSKAPGPRKGDKNVLSICCEDDVDDIGVGGSGGRGGQGKDKGMDRTGITRADWFYTPGRGGEPCYAREILDVCCDDVLSVCCEDLVEELEKLEGRKGVQRPNMRGMGGKGPRGGGR
ncbi:hypothetical protein AMATHDRAFT_174894 [Amanita thiersii Skay4041]|uniref:SET domain-containing protein n=1 Tax=Amanita thiersii Skay4041 TaxID=703135 RepID=A0A2A9NUZ4_9AGAR|nr:hypothetical protein AMATHDRAFT_174894 [Amanita thiersii Skay4041]